jgi:tellurite resistance protein TerC
VFGAVLLVTAARLLVRREGAGPSAGSRFVRAAGRRARIHPSFEGGRLFVRRDGRVLATQLLVALALIEMTDLLFAVDSVPAVFSVTDDAFVAFTSNALAILGLRSLFFLVAAASVSFRYLGPALVAVLAFIGLKMILSGVLEVPVWASLVVIALALGAGIGVSVAVPRRPEEQDRRREETVQK